MNIVIAHFNTNWVNFSGGVEKVTCQLANALCKRGHQVTILYRDGKEGPPYFPLDSSVKTDNILFENGKKVISEKLPPHYRIGREIARVFSQKAAQGINAQHNGKQYGAAIRKRLSQIQPDVIITTSVPSTVYTLTDTGYRGPLVTMIHAQPDIQFPLLSEREKKYAAQSSVIQILTPSGITTAKRYFPNTNICVIGNTVEIPRSLNNRNPDIPIITSVGTICDRKNQRLIISAFKLIANRFPKWHVELWGSVDENYGNLLKKDIHESGFEDRIHIKGQTSHVLEDVYSRSNIFATPSKAEGFSLALTEAMAAGLPPVALSNYPGNIDLIKNEQTGFLTKNNPQSFAAALARLMEDAELRQKMGSAARESMLQYDPEVIFNQWESLLNDLVKNK